MKSAEALRAVVTSEQESWIRYPREIPSVVRTGDLLADSTAWIIANAWVNPSMLNLCVCVCVFGSACMNVCFNVYITHLVHRTTQPLSSCVSVGGTPDWCSQGMRV